MVDKGYILNTKITVSDGSNLYLYNDYNDSYSTIDESITSIDGNYNLVGKLANSLTTTNNSALYNINSSLNVEIESLTGANYIELHGVTISKLKLNNNTKLILYNSIIKTIECDGDLEVELHDNSNITNIYVNKINIQMEDSYINQITCNTLYNDILLTNSRIGNGIYFNGIENTEDISGQYQFVLNNSEIPIIFFDKINSPFYNFSLSNGSYININTISKTQTFTAFDSTICMESTSVAPYEFFNSKIDIDIPGASKVYLGLCKGNISIGDCDTLVAIMNNLDIDIVGKITNIYIHMNTGNITLNDMSTNISLQNISSLIVDSIIENIEFNDIENIEINSFGGSYFYINDLNMFDSTTITDSSYIECLNETISKINDVKIEQGTIDRTDSYIKLYNLNNKPFYINGLVFKNMDELEITLQ